MNQFDVLVVGGGTGGISVAARLSKLSRFPKIAVIEPSSTHYYQPLWTLVGGGVMDKQKTARPQNEYIPRGVSWIQDSVTELKPDANSVTTATGKFLHYRYLVLAPGLEMFWDRIHGLSETLGKNGVCSNYSYATVDSTWRAIQEFSGGNAIFTFPNTPVKCGGAPQKIMYLAEEAFRRRGVRERAEVHFISAGTSIFAVKKYADALLKVIQSRDIKTLYQHNLVAVDGGRKIATFEDVNTKERRDFPFALLHVAPPMGAPAFIRQSAVAGADGYIEVDKHSLQHRRYPNIFALGDAAALPTSKTGAAIRKQAPVLVKNLVALDRKLPFAASYDGYTSCPLVTGYGKLILAEFDYDGKPKETFPFDQSKERLSMYLLKKYLLPLLYWAGMLRGRA